MYLKNFIALLGRGRGKDACMGIVLLLLLCVWGFFFWGGGREGAFSIIFSPFQRQKYIRVPRFWSWLKKNTH